MCEQLKAVGLRLNARSLLRTATDIIESKGNLPGEFKLQLKRTRRNASDLQMDNSTLRKIRALCRLIALPQPNNMDAVRLVKGVRMNGRPVSSRDVCVYVRPIPRAQAAGAAAALWHGVCTVIAFYHVECGDQAEVFVEVVGLERVVKQRSIFIINKIGLIVTGADTFFLHADSFLVKLHIAPHFDGNEELVCGIPMWETR